MKTQQIFNQEIRKLYPQTTDYMSSLIAQQARTAQLTRLLLTSSILSRPMTLAPTYRIRALCKV